MSACIFRHALKESLQVYAAKSKGRDVCNSHPRGILVWEEHLVEVRVLGSDLGLNRQFLRVRQESEETAILSDTVFGNRLVQ